MIRRVRTIDAHAAGEPLRLIVEGFPAPRGRTMMGKREWVTQEQDHLRRALIFEPRGHADMFAAILTEPVSPEAHAGIVFMHHHGYPAMSGHGIIALTTTALERDVLLPGGDGASVVFDTPAGLVRAKASLKRNSAGATRVERVSFVNVPSFVACGGLIVKIGSRQVRVDIGFGGAFYAIVDGEAVGLPIDDAHLPELRRAGMAIQEALERSHPITHPVDPGLNGMSGTIFSGPSSVPSTDLRNVTIFAGGQVQRSPSGTGMAVMAVLSAMGLLVADRPFVYESMIGSVFEGRVVGRTAVGEYDAVIPEITGSAWVTGEHTFLIDDDDPFKTGF